VHRSGTAWGIYHHVHQLTTLSVKQYDHAPLMESSGGA
jgi:hypothetical protein